MVVQTTKVKNGTIVLPKEIRKSWKGADVFVVSSGDMISIKKLTPPKLTLREMMDEFRRAARKAKVTKKDVEGAVREARKELHK